MDAQAPSDAGTPSVKYAGSIEYAGFWRRLIAWALDSVITVLAALLAGLALGAAAAVAGMSEAAVESLAGLVAFAIFVLYFPLLESSARRATPGKMALGLIVTGEGGGRVSFGRALGRNLAKVLSAFILGIGYLMAAFTERKQGLHDKLAGCLVVRK